MGECQKICLEEEIIEEGRFQEVGEGRGDYVYTTQMVGQGKGHLVKLEPKKTYTCSTCCQVFMCLLLLALFVGLLIWLATYFGDDVFKNQKNRDEVASADDSGFNCNEGYSEWRTTWNLSKQKHCCATMGRACDFLDCSGSPESWEMDQRSACCDKGVKEACAPSPHPFNCDAGLSNWRHGWSFGKKKWCCENKKVACGPASAPAQHPLVQVVHHVVHHLPAAHHGPRPVHVVQEVQQPVMYPAYHSNEPFHCYAGVKHWFTLWSKAKKHYCCTKSSVFCGDYAGNSGMYGGHMAHFVHGDTFHSHAGYGYYTGGHDGSYSYGQSGGYSYGHSYGHGHVSHGSYGSYGHGHFSSGHGSYSAGIPTCGLSVAHQCPSDWQNGQGGFHCLHQLARQTSHKAYLESGGACRPASQGPFPSNDCQDQCRIGLHAPHVYK